MVHPMWNAYPDIQQGLEQVKELILSDMRPPHPALAQTIRDYVHAPGKYLRSGLCLLTAMESQGELTQGRLYLAAYLEVLHLATLIHDDVIDEADLRRGLPTVQTRFSNRIAIYTGDYLLAYAARLAAKGLELLDLSERPQLPQLDQTLLERILAGELAQLVNQFNRQMTLKDYLKQIQGKTAFLFGHAMQLGLLRADVADSQLRQAFRAGRAFGTAFQLRDDVLDYRLSASQSGKPVLQDLTNGIYTAPLLLALRKDRTLESDLASLESGVGTDNLLDSIARKVEQAGTISETEQWIAVYLDKMRQYVARVEGLDPAGRLTLLADQVFAAYF